jgi:hypothetical protein
VRANKRTLSGTHREEIRKMKDWLEDRADWMDDHMNLDDLSEAARN